MSRKGLVHLRCQDLGKLRGSLIPGVENGKIWAGFSSNITFSRHLRQPHSRPGNPTLSTLRGLYTHSVSKGDIFLGLVYLVETPKWSVSWWIQGPCTRENLEKYQSRMNSYFCLQSHDLLSACSVSGIVLSTQCALLNKTHKVPALRELKSLVGGIGIKQIIIQITIRVTKGKYQMLREGALLWGMTFKLRIKIGTSKLKDKGRNISRRKKEPFPSIPHKIPKVGRCRVLSENWKKGLWGWNEEECTPVRRQGQAWGAGRSHWRFLPREQRGMSLKGLQQGSNMIRQAFLKDHSGCVCRINWRGKLEGDQLGGSCSNPGQFWKDRPIDKSTVLRSHHYITRTQEFIHAWATTWRKIFITQGHNISLAPLHPSLPTSLSWWE